MKNWSKMFVVLMVGLSFVACSGKKGGGRKDAGQPAATQDAPDADETSNEAVDQKLAQFKLTGKNGNNQNFQLNVKHEAASIKLTGMIADDANIITDDPDHDLNPQALVQSFEGLGFISVLFRLGNSNDAQFFLFVSNDDDTYTLLTEGIKAEWRAKLNPLQQALNLLARKKDLTKAQAVAYFTQLHLADRELSLKELIELLRKEAEEVAGGNDQGNGNGNGNDDDNDNEDRDDDEISQYLPTDEDGNPVELNDNVEVVWSPMPNSGYAEVPNEADRIPPWRADGEADYGYDDTLTVPAPTGHGQQGDILIGPALPVIDEATGLRIIDNGGYGSARILCAHDARSSAAGSFRSNSYLTHEGNQRLLKPIDVCVPSNGNPAATQMVKVRHEDSFLGIYYYGDSELGFSVDFTLPADRAHRMIKELFITKAIVTNEIPLERGLTHSAGRGEFSKTFYFEGAGLNNLTIRCEIYRFESSNSCR